MYHLQEHLQLAKTHAENEIKDLEEDIMDYVAVEEKRHSEQMKTLEAKVSDAKLKLRNLREQNSIELQDVMEQRDHLEKKALLTEHEHDAEEKRLVQEIQAIRDKTKLEVDEKIQYYTDNI